MKKRLFLHTTLIIFAGLLWFFSVTVVITSKNNLKIAKDTVMETTQICADLYIGGIDPESFVKAGNAARITVISEAGEVLADSRPIDFETAENHLDRPEVQAALKGSPKTVVRHSDTLGQDYIYYAVKVNAGGEDVFIRTAVPVEKVNAYMTQSLPLLCIMFLLVALLCFFLIRGVTARILEPFNYVEEKLKTLANRQYSEDTRQAAAVEKDVSKYEEINKITRSINEVAEILQQNIKDLYLEKGKLYYIINHITDAIFAVDENKNVALINLAATELFDVTEEILGNGMNYLSYEKSLLDAIESRMNNDKNSWFEIVLKDRIFFVTVKFLGGVNLTMVIMSDVTETRENAKRREEFFANASHELKTPLTAIKGFNELTQFNNKDESLNKYICGIAREADRMLSLIGNMLRLSEFENTENLNPVQVSLAKVVNEVGEALLPSIEEKNLSFEVTGDNTVTAEQAHVYELVKNIIENAVRYNVEFGSVSVKIDSGYMVVSDTGIGIPHEKRSRIFERFYRVEKSRSQTKGGTGLGLSIVKHICEIYGWKLSLKSRLGIGTEVVLEFEAL